MCDPQFKDFYKIESKTFTFLHRSHFPHMPCLTRPQGNQEFISEHFISLSLFFTKLTKIKTRFLAAVALSPNQLVLFICLEKKGRAVATFARQDQEQISRCFRKTISIDHCCTIKSCL